MTSKDIEKLEKLSRKQNKSEVCHRERQWRLTSSHFGRMCKLTNRANVNKFSKNLSTRINLNHRPSINHGLTYENEAREQFILITGLNVVKCGLIMLENYPFLAASPDGLIDKDSLIEIKCPYTGREQIIIIIFVFIYVIVTYHNKI